MKSVVQNICCHKQSQLESGASLFKTDRAVKSFSESGPFKAANGPKLRRLRTALFELAVRVPYCVAARRGRREVLVGGASKPMIDPGLEARSRVESRDRH